MLKLPSGPRTPPRPLLAEVAGPADAPVPGTDRLPVSVMVPTPLPVKPLLVRSSRISPQIHDVPNEPMARRIVPQARQAGIRPPAAKAAATQTRRLLMTNDLQASPRSRELACDLRW